jgi:uroporphyrinogen decarboxylase
LFAFFTAQIEAGVDAIQIFDSWASAVPDASYEDWSLQYIRRIVEELGTQCRFILFAKGRARNAAQLAATGVPALAIDHSVKLADVRHSLQNTAPQLVLQGNLDPVWMTREPDAASEEVRSILDSLHPWDHYIFNLGHGITPEARLDTVEAVLNTINEAATWKGPH